MISDLNFQILIQEISRFLTRSTQFKGNRMILLEPGNLIIWAKIEIILKFFYENDHNSSASNPNSNLIEYMKRSTSLTWVPTHWKFDWNLKKVKLEGKTLRFSKCIGPKWKILNSKPGSWHNFYQWFQNYIFNYSFKISRDFWLDQHTFIVIGYQNKTSPR